MKQNRTDIRTIKIRLLAGFILAIAWSSAADAQMRASTLFEHCAKSSEPDGICLGYMAAALDFITEYQLWLTLNKYDYPPKDKPICIKNETPPREAAVAFVVWMKARGDIGWTAANAAVGDALREAYACKK